MLSRRTRTTRTKESEYRCRDCAEAYDRQNRSVATGELILCRCRFYKNGRWCKFLGDATCQNFRHV